MSSAKVETQVTRSGAHLPHSCLQFLKVAKCASCNFHCNQQLLHYINLRCSWTLTYTSSVDCLWLGPHYMGKFLSTTQKNLKDRYKHNVSIISMQKCAQICVLVLTVFLEPCSQKTASQNRLCPQANIQAYFSAKLEGIVYLFTGDIVQNCLVCLWYTENQFVCDFRGSTKYSLHWRCKTT